MIVAANRDERFERPAAPAGVLRWTSPRIVGGRDLRAGGTWLAVSEAGVVAGLTNKPGERDPARRSRGEIPLLAAGGASARGGIDALVAAADGGSYSPCWVLAGDRSALYALDLTASTPRPPVSLPAGIHVLENKPLDVASAKVDRVRHLIGDIEGRPIREVVDLLRTVLRDHVVTSAPTGDDAEARLRSRASACCVHSEEYGTRATSLVLVPAAPHDPPRMWASEGPSCTHPLREVAFDEAGVA